MDVWFSKPFLFWSKVPMGACLGELDNGWFFMFLQNGEHELYAKYIYFSKLKVLQNYKYYWNVNSEYIKLLNETNLYNTFLYLKDFNESHIFHYFFIIYRRPWVLIWVSVYSGTFLFKKYVQKRSRALLWAGVCFNECDLWISRKLFWH